jgi:hypothetical protein
MKGLRAYRIDSFPADVMPGLHANMQQMTRILLVPIFLLPLLWVWPQRGVTAAFYTNPQWENNPAIVSVERRINLDFLIAHSASLPQQQFSVEWSGWLRIDRDGEYTFSTRTDDGSTLEIDGRIVVDNGGVHKATRRTATVSMTAGLHQIRLRFLQAAGVYEFFASWTPPGDKTESALPTEQLFVHRPPAVVVFLTRRIALLWVLCWGALALVAAARIAKRARGIAKADLREFALRLTLSLAATVVALLVAEGIARLVYYVREDRRPLEVQLQSSRAQAQASMHDLRLGEIVQPSRHPDIVFDLRPNVRGRFMGQPLLVNSQGLRDYEYSRRKEPGTFRIVGLGDSSLFGWGVPFEDSGLKVLERRLNEKSRAQKFEVINFAVPGYNTAMEAETFVQKCVEYAPDLVLLNFNTNDYDVPNFMRRPRNLATLRRSYLFDLAYSVYEGVMGVGGEQPPAFDFRNRTTARREAEHLDRDPALPKEYRHMVGSKGVVRALERLAGAARERGIPLVVFDVKPYPGLQSTYVRDEWRDGQRELLERESQRLGFHFLNTYPYYVDYLNRHPDADLRTVFAVSAIDGHPNTLAHSINAEAIFDFLVARQLLPFDQASNHDR